MVSWLCIFFSQNVDSYRLHEPALLYLPYVIFILCYSYIMHLPLESNVNVTWPRLHVNDPFNVISKLVTLLVFCIHSSVPSDTGR